MALKAKEKIAVFISGGGTNFQCLIDGVASGKINADIVLCVSSNQEAYGLERAKKAGIETFVAKLSSYPCGNCRDSAILEQLKKHKVRYIFLCGYLGIITPIILEKYKQKIVNIHPSLLPHHGGVGMYGTKPHQEVLRLREPFTGATAHFVDEGTDTGAIIMQKSVPVLPSDTVETLQQKVLTECEHIILPRVAELLCSGKIRVDKNGKVIIAE